jgi:hypothetical protein
MQRHDATFSLCRRLMQSGTRRPEADQAMGGGDALVTTYRDFAARRWPLSASLMLFRRDFIDGTLFDPVLPSANDLDVLLFILSRTPALLIDETLVIMDKVHDAPRLSDHYENKLVSYERIEKKLIEHHYELGDGDIQSLKERFNRDRLYLHFLSGNAAAFSSLYASVCPHILSARDRAVFFIARMFAACPPLMHRAIRAAEIARRQGIAKM